MDRQVPGPTEGRFTLPDFDLDRSVRILRGEHRSICGAITVYEFNGGSEGWLYFVKHSRVEYGPYITKEL